MPELPEVETIRLKLIPDLVGKTIKDIEVFSDKQFIGVPGDIIGKKISRIGRTGKVLNIYLNGGLILNIHLKMSGQLLYSPDRSRSKYKNIIPFAKSDTMPARTTRIIFTFADHSALYFNDLRKFGWMKITEEPLGPTAPDVLDKSFTLGYLREITRKSGKPVKTLLMDQEKISGIGNIYANDALFLAHIMPTRKASSLSDKSIELLYDAIKKVIKQGIKDLGSTGGDEAFILPDGSWGKHQSRFLVYDREGEPCINCKKTVKRLKHGGRSSYFCPACQK